jgi:hypothetical protein
MVDRRYLRLEPIHGAIVDRRLATHHMKTPTSQDVVLPVRPTPAIEIEPVVEHQPGAERAVSYDHVAIPADRGLERLSAARVAEIRTRLDRGAYNSPEVMTVLAMRLLESGDLTR